MTYLNLMNNVLRRLREEEVTSVQSTTYSKMAGDFVNDAKRIVEDSWDWSALRTTLTITTTDDIFNYVLTGSQNRIKELNVICLLYTSPSPRDRTRSRMPSSA